MASVLNLYTLALELRDSCKYKGNAHPDQSDPSCVLPRAAGQAVVQFAREHYGRCEHAVKFFLDRDAFLTEAALYAACAPRADDTDLLTAKGRSGDAAAAHSPATEATSVGAVSNFLPQVEAVCDGLADGGIDTQGRQLPPCIVMEKGESLQDWSDRGESDLYTTLAVRAAGHAPGAVLPGSPGLPLPSSAHAPLWRFHIGTRASSASVHELALQELHVSREAQIRCMAVRLVVGVKTYYSSSTTTTVLLLL